MSIGEAFEFLARTVGELVLEVVGYFTGRIVIPVFTFGRVHVEPGRKGEWTKPRWRRLVRLPDGTYLMSAEMGATWGALLWISVGIAYALFRDASQ